jgi:membrane-associated phospholipid phosphatase
VIGLMTAAVPARAQTIASPPPATPSLLMPFGEVLGDIRHLPTRNNLNWLAVGLAAALVAHPTDHRIARNWTETGSPSFKPGAIIGGTPFELGAAFATYAIGRATDNRRAMAVGSDLVRAQLLSELMASGLKQAVRRSRPEGTGFSFPSGHTTVSFASATVLQRHFGWKVGVPAYAVASYVAASRLEMRRHYLSDVAFGATLGILAGRTVTVGGGHHLMVTPIAGRNGGGVGLTWIGK